MRRVHRSEPGDAHTPHGQNRGEEEDEKAGALQRSISICIAIRYTRHTVCACGATTFTTLVRTSSPRSAAMDNRPSCPAPTPLCLFLRTVSNPHVHRPLACSLPILPDRLVCGSWRNHECLRCRRLHQRRRHHDLAPRQPASRALEYPRRRLFTLLPVVCRRRSRSPPTRTPAT